MLVFILQLRQNHEEASGSWKRSVQGARICTAFPLQALSNIRNRGALPVRCLRNCQGIYKRVAVKERGGVGGVGGMFLRMLWRNGSNYGAGCIRKEAAAAGGIKKQSLKLPRRHRGIRRERDDVIYWLQILIFPSWVGEFLGGNKVPGVARRVGGRLQQAWEWRFLRGRSRDKDKMGRRCVPGLCIPWGSA